MHKNKIKKEQHVSTMLMITTAAGLGGWFGIIFLKALVVAIMALLLGLIGGPQDLMLVWVCGRGLSSLGHW